MFLTSDEFDKSMVYFIRNTTKNFIEQNEEASMNGLPIKLCPIVEEMENAKDLKDYIKNILMKENEDA